VEFHSYPTHFDVFRGEYKNRGELVALSLASGNSQFAGQVDVENRWISEKRPYYSVWPAITEALKTIRLT
jgi:hypothetical protein